MLLSHFLLIPFSPRFPKPTNLLSVFMEFVYTRYFREVESYHMWFMSEFFQLNVFPVRLLYSMNQHFICFYGWILFPWMDMTFFVNSYLFECMFLGHVVTLCLVFGETARLYESVYESSYFSTSLSILVSFLKKLKPSYWFSSVQFSSVAQSCPTLRPHESQHARPPCPTPTLGVHSDSRPSSPWCHPAISSSVIPFSSCLQSLPASKSFPMSQLFTWGG